MGEGGLSSDPWCIMERAFLINSGTSSSLDFSNSVCDFLLTHGGVLLSFALVFRSWFSQGAVCLPSSSSSFCCLLLSRSSIARSLLCLAFFKISLMSIPPAETGAFRPIVDDFSCFMFLFGGGRVLLWEEMGVVGALAGICGMGLVGKGGAFSGR